VVIIASFLSVSVFLSNGLMEIQWPLKITLKYRQSLMGVQMKQSPNPLYTIKARVNKLKDELFFAKSEYFEANDLGSNKDMSQQIRQYENAHLDGRGGGFVWGFILIFFTIVGIVATFLNHWKISSSEVLLLFLWFMLSVLLLLLTNTLPWQRYYIVLHVQMAIFIGIGTKFLYDYLKTILQTYFGEDNKLVS